MLMLWELKKNLKFFLSMTLVITLLMSAGVSLFNFAFEINRTITESLKEEFIYGYVVQTRGFRESPVKIPGADYVYYESGGYKYYDTGDAEWDEDAPTPCFWPRVYAFEDHLPQNFVRAMADFEDFCLSGTLWTSADNEMTDGAFSLYVSEGLAANAAEVGVDMTVGSRVSISERERMPDDDYEGATIDFVIRGIYRSVDIPRAYHLPSAVISLEAERVYCAHFDKEIGHTNYLINSIRDFKTFSKFAAKNGIEYSAYIEDDLALVNLFSVIFSVLGVAILLLCGGISYVYCGMYLHRRINFIGLIKAMGLTSGQIAKQFFVLLLIILSAALLFGNLFSLVWTSHFSKLAFTLFEYKLNTGFNGLSQLIFAALTVLTTALSVVLLSRKINRISIAQTLTQKE